MVLGVVRNQCGLVQRTCLGGMLTDLLFFRGRKTTHHVAFSLTLDSVDQSSLDFVAPDEEVFDYWTDGINALLGKTEVIFSCTSLN